MGVKCKININNTNEFYRAGDSVQGTVNYVIDKPTEFTSVNLSVKGKPFWNWSFHLRSTVYKDSNTLVDEIVDLLEAKENGSEIIPAGTYEKHFCFKLPEEIPSSFNGQYYYIFFYSFFVQLEFVKPNSRSVQKFNSDIKNVTMKPHGPEITTVLWKDKLLMSKKSVTSVLSIKKPFVYAGEDIEVKILVKKSCPKVPLISTTIQLVQHTIHDSYNNFFEEYHKVLKGIEIKHLGIDKLQTMTKYTHTFTTSPNVFTKHSKKLRIQFWIHITQRFSKLLETSWSSYPIAIAEKIEDYLENESTPVTPEDISTYL